MLKNLHMLICKWWKACEKSLRWYLKYDTFKCGLKKHDFIQNPCENLNRCSFVVAATDRERTATQWSLSKRNDMYWHVWSLSLPRLLFHVYILIKNNPTNRFSPEAHSSTFYYCYATQHDEFHLTTKSNLYQSIFQEWENDPYLTAICPPSDHQTNPFGSTLSL